MTGARDAWVRFQAGPSWLPAESRGDLAGSGLPSTSSTVEGPCAGTIACVETAEHRVALLASQLVNKRQDLRLGDAQLENRRRRAASSLVACRSRHDLRCGTVLRPCRTRPQHDVEIRHGGRPRSSPEIPPAERTPGDPRRSLSEASGLPTGLSPATRVPCPGGAPALAGRRGHGSHRHMATQSSGHGTLLQPRWDVGTGASSCTLRDSGQTRTPAPRLMLTPDLPCNRSDRFAALPSQLAEHH
jgi:hypothetical protein